MVSRWGNRSCVTLRRGVSTHQHRDDTPLMRPTFLALALLACAAPLAAQAPAPAPPPTVKLSGTVDAGFVSASGNTDVTTINVGDKLTLLYDGWTFSQFLAQVYAKTKGVESANQLRGGLRAERTIIPAVGIFAAVVYERNAYAGFNRRLDEQLGVQWNAITDSSDVLTFDAGGVLTQQDNTDGTTRSSPAARAASAYKHTFRKNTFLSQTLEYVADLQSGGGYRLNSETAAVAPLSTRISIKLGYVLQYNSAPPATFGTTDRVFTSGLQVSF